MIRLLSRSFRDMAFLFSLLSPSFRKSCRWAKQLLDHTVEMVTEDTKGSKRKDPNWKALHYKSISQFLIGQLHQNYTIDKAYRFS